MSDSDEVRRVQREQREDAAFLEDNWAEVEEWDWMQIDALIDDWGSGPETAGAMTAQDVLRAFAEAAEEQAVGRTTAIGRARRVAAEVAVTLVCEGQAEAKAEAARLREVIDAVREGCEERDCDYIPVTDAHWLVIIAQGKAALQALRTILRGEDGASDAP